MIKDRNKTKEHLIEELNALRKRVAELEILEIESGQELDAGQSRGQDYFRMLVESSLDAFVVLNRDLTVRYESPAIDQLLGVKYDERIGKSPFEFIDPDDRQVVNEHLLQLIENPDASMRMEVRILLRDGTCRFVEGIGQNMLNDPTVEGIFLNVRDNTERRLAEEALRQKEEYFRTLIEKASDGIVILDENGRLCYESPSMERLLGLNPEERIGMNAFEFVHPDDIKKAGEAFNKLTKGRVQTVTIEIRGRHRDGSWRILRIVGRNFLDDPKIRGIVANFSDITERKQAEEALKTSEARFRALTLNSLDAIAIIDKEGNLLEQIPATENVLGYEGGKRIGRNAFEFVHPDDLQFVNKSLSLLMRKPGSSRHIEVRARHKDGSWRTLEVTARNLFKDPAVQGIVANYRDITERRQAEEALKEREEHFRALIENSLDAIAILDRSGAAVYVNQSFERVLGVTAADVQGKKWFPWVHPDDLERTTEAFIELMQKHGATAHGEVRVSSNDGSWRTIETVAQNLLHYPAVGGIVANFRDRTELKQAEAELRFQQEYFRSLIENSQEVIVVLDKEGDIQYESPSLETVTGYKPYERIGRSIFEYVHPDDLPGLTEILPKLMQSPRSIMHREFRGKWKDGWHDVEASAQNLLDDPVVKGVVINFRDITERKDAEKKRQEYYEQEKAVRQQLEEEMRRRIEFTRALAHELKTPLTSVLASCDSLIEKLEDEPLLGLARNINRGAVNLNTRIDELLDLARGEIGILEIHVEPTDMLRLLRDAADSMAPVAVNRRQSLDLELPQFLPPVQADAARIQQVVFNIVSNAIKFTPRDGKIKIRAGMKDGSLVVEVQDTGRGMSNKEQARVFEPYQRIERNGENSGGLGLGLALSKRLVELHNGQIWVRSRANKGTTIGFSLPFDSETVSEKAIEDKSVGKSWKLLIIEDDVEIVDSINLTFQMDWPEVALVSTRLGEEGIDLAESEQPDVIVLDLGLPDISGFEVLKQIRQFSTVPIIVLTVRTEEADLIRGLEYGADDYITKPFRQRELLARLKVQLRRNNMQEDEDTIVCGPLSLDASTYQLKYGARDISLTIIEGRIMQCLMKNAGHVITHSRLAEAVWYEDYPGALDSLRVYIGYLRNKIEKDPSNPRIIRTKTGVGYSLVKPEYE